MAIIKKPNLPDKKVIDVIVSSDAVDTIKTLKTLGINSVSGPIEGFVSSFISYLPNIIAAIILVYVGVLVAQILGQIVAVLLKKTKIDNLIKRVDEEERKTLMVLNTYPFNASFNALPSAIAISGGTALPTCLNCWVLFPVK